MNAPLTPTRQTPAGTVTGPLVAAIEATWAAIQSRHPDVPDVVLTLGNGSTRPGQLTLGHFHAGKWATRDTDAEAAARLPELFIGGEGLAAGPRELLGTLLHEAAHGVAAARGIQDTSRQGRYHNTRYRDLAVELGLTVERDPRIGWSLTTVPDSTADLYSERTAELGEAIRAHRLADAHGTGRGTTSNNGLAATCECAPPRKIRLSRTAYDAGPVICGVCESEFSAPDTTTDTSPSHEGRARMTTDDRSQQAERPMVIEYLTDPPSVGDQVEPGAQLRWLNHLHSIGATREQIDTATEPLLARLDRAVAAVTGRESEHIHAARLGLQSYRRDIAAGVPAEQARHDAVTTAATLAAALHHPDDPRRTREAELLATPVTIEHIDTAATPALRDTLTRTVAAQQAITELRDSHAATVDDVIGLYNDGRDEDAEDAEDVDQWAADAALIEAEQGVPAVYQNAYYDLDYRSELRAERLQALRADVDAAQALVEQRRREHHEIAGIVASGRREGVLGPADLAWGRVEEIQREHQRDRVGEDLLDRHPVRSSDIDAADGPARDALIRIAAAEQAVRELRDSYGDTIEHTLAEYERARVTEPDHAAWQRAYQHATAAVDAQVEDSEHCVRQAAAEREAAARAEPDPHELAALLAGAEQRRATARNEVDDLDRLRGLLLADQKERARRAADPAVHQHNAVINSLAVHAATREHHDDPSASTSETAELGGEDSGRHRVERGDAAIDSARTAVNALAARRRELDARRDADAARAEQLTRWQRDDRQHNAAAGDHEQAPVRGGRAIYGWGSTR